MSLNAEALVAWMNTLPPEAMWVATLVVCFAAVLLLLRLFGETGLYVYIAVAILGANVQVLKAVKFGLYADPVALGTILFASTYLCTDILAEHYGARAARRGIAIGFASFLLFTVFMVLTLGFRPMTPQEAGESMAWALDYHGHMAALFTPAPAFFAAGMIAYLASQFHDVWLFSLLKRTTGGRFLWLRNNASTAVSALIDNTIFSVLAWVVFAETAVPWEAVVFTYILGTYWLRLVVALFDTPIIYLSRLTLPAAARPAPA